jgi:hypothetical protein
VNVTNSVRAVIVVWIALMIVIGYLLFSVTVHAAIDTLTVV